ncbi:MAG: M20 family metallopeptidase [Actinomycetota bacterium]|nr:M20 family metallopeptidase [Actinomycetota bacterium]
MTADLQDAASGLLGHLVELRRTIHRHPELGLELPRTQQVVLDALGDLDLEVTTGEGTTSVVARLRGGRPGPTVLLRGDMDALPMPEDTGLDFASEVGDTMHACGHDAHTAMLIGAAHLLEARRSQLAGDVLFMFQPGEEGHHGARVMLDEGLLDGIDAALAFAIHVTPNMPAGMIGTRAGALLASADTVRITITGKGGHASMPHHCVDPIPAACELVGALQTRVTRRIDPFRPAVLTISQINAGTTTNVIPESAVLAGTLRTVDPRTREEMTGGITEVANAIAAAHGCEADVDLDAGYPVTVNHGSAADAVRAIAAGVLDPAKVIELPTPMMGAEDFSYVLERVPGAMAFLGVCPPGLDPATAAPNHSNRMLLDEDAMVAGAALHAAVALDTLTSPTD